MGGENIFLDRIDIYKTGIIKEIVVARPGKDFRNKFLLGNFSSIINFSDALYL